MAFYEKWSCNVQTKEISDKLEHVLRGTFRDAWIFGWLYDVFSSPF